jgi:methyl-accepting chemotaxis protein
MKNFSLANIKMTYKLPGTQKVSTNIAEVSRGVQETGSVAGQVLEASNQLSQQAGDLQTAISGFLDNVKAA